MRVRASAAAGAALTLCLGCLPKAEGDRLVREAEARDARIAELETALQTMDAQRAEMESALAEAREQVARLEEVLQRATDVVTRNSADLGTEVAGMRELIQALQGAVAELRNEAARTRTEAGAQLQELDRRIEALARRAGVDMPLEESEIPAEREAHFTAGEAAYRAGDQARARALLRVYVTRYGDDEKADDALLLIARAYLDQDRPASALADLRRLLSEFPRSDVADQALFRMGDAFYALHSCTDARGAWELLRSNHPRSRHASETRQKLRALRRAPRGHCRS